MTKGYVDPATSPDLSQNIELLGGSILGLGTFAWWLKANWRKSEPGARLNWRESMW
jgi:hypothetical protein